MARFIRRGVSKIRFAPTIANKNAVTRIEITGSTDLTPDVASVNGFMLEGSQVPTPDFGSDFDSSIPGIDSAADSSLGFYEDDATDTIETLLPKGTEGYILLFRKGDVPTSESLDVFPVKVGSRGAAWSAGNEPAQFNVNFNITDKPGLDTTIPAAV
jgi:hypothetical protein